MDWWPVRDFKVLWEISIKINFNLTTFEPFNLQFQTHDTANEAVAEQVDVENLASQLQTNNVHIIKKRKWKNEEKLKIVQINKEERQKGKNFMKRIKQRKDIEFPKRKERCKS